MFRLIFFLAVALLFTCCQEQVKPFEFEIKGKVKGRVTGQLIFQESGRYGDEVIIPIEDGKFAYKGSSGQMFSSFIQICDDETGVFYPIVIEPGEICLELNADSLFRKSKITKGINSIAVQNAMSSYMRYFDHGTTMAALPDSIKKLVQENSSNFAGILLMNTMGKQMPVLNTEELGKYLQEVTNPMFRQSRDFVELNSYWRGRKDSVNMMNHRALNFILPDENEINVEFGKVAKGKVTLVEKSGSWCGNLTEVTRSFEPVYERFKDNGFEIITVVCESKYDRWKEWVEEEKFPWITLIEMENAINKDVLYGELLFRESNYLVDEQGVVIANNVSAASLNELLMKKYAPEEYRKFVEEKWRLPKATHILDRGQSIESFSKLVDKLSGKPMFIDCWATTCSPCINEFKYKEGLEEFLQSENIELVYINFDSQCDEAKWLNYIKKFELKGNHVRANESFKADFYQLGFEGILPTYMIVNKQGIIVEANAFRPSSRENLYNQIKQKLN